MVKYKKNSSVKPIKITLDTGFVRVYLNQKDKTKVSISAQEFINRILNTIILNAAPMTIEEDKTGVFIKFPVFKKIYKYEALVNGNHFWFYSKL